MTRPVCFLLTIALWLSAPAPPCPAQPPPGPLVVVLLPGSNSSDWDRADAPTLHRLMAEGARAVMNTRTARLPNDHTRESPESAALTLGAGSRAAGGPEATDFQPADLGVLQNVTAGELYTRRTGAVPPTTSLVNAQWPRVLRENQGRGYDIRLGNLGDALAQHSIRVYAASGQDGAVTTAGDGTVPYLFPTEVFLASVYTSPFSPPEERAFLIDQPREFAVVTSSLNAGSDRCLINLSRWIQRTHGRLIVVSPSVSDAEYARGERLAPVVVWGEGVAPGMLYSPSTHQAGLVTNTDFAPTVAAYFGATLPVKAFGGPWQVHPASNAEGTVARLEAQAYRQSRAMRLLPPLAVVLGLAILFGTADLFYKSRRLSPRLKSGAIAEWTVRLRGRGTVQGKFLRPRRRAVFSASAPDFSPGKRGTTFRSKSLMALFFFPAALVLALLPCDSPLLFLTCLALLMVLPFAARGFDTRLTLTGMAAIVGVLVLDMCLGGPLMRRGMLGYSAVEGARYYGIGNEAMGALIGAALVVAARLWRPGSRVRNGLVVLALAAIAVLLGSPFAGAKAGGLLVAVGSFLTLVWRLRGGAWNGRVVVWALSAAALALGVMALLDLHGGQQTHIGRALGRILGGGFGEAGDIVARKLAVEGRLLYHSAWAVPLWASVVGLALLRRRVSVADHQTQALGQAGWVAVALCLAVNDAGVVAAALCAALLWSGLMAI